MKHLNMLILCSCRPLSDAEQRLSPTEASSGAGSVGAEAVTVWVAALLLQPPGLPPARLPPHHFHTSPAQSS